MDKWVIKSDDPASARNFIELYDSREEAEKHVPQDKIMSEGKEVHYWVEKKTIKIRR